MEKNYRFEYLLKVENDEDVKVTKELIEEIKKFRDKLDRRKKTSYTGLLGTEIGTASLEKEQLAKDIKEVNTGYNKLAIGKVEHSNAKNYLQNSEITTTNPQNTVEDILNTVSQGWLYPLEKSLSLIVPSVIEKDIKILQDLLDTMLNDFDEDIEALQGKVDQYESEKAKKDEEEQKKSDKWIAATKAGRKKDEIRDGVSNNGAAWEFSEEAEKLYGEYFDLLTEAYTDINDSWFSTSYDLIRQEQQAFRTKRYEYFKREAAKEKEATKEIQEIHYDANAGMLVAEEEHTKHLSELEEADAKKRLAREEADAKIREEAYKKGILQQKNALAEGIITKEQYASIEEKATLLYLENEIETRRSYGAETLDIENQLADMRIAIKEREVTKAEAIRQAEQKKAEAALKKQQEGIKAMGKNLGELGKEVDTPWLSASLNGIGKLVEKFSDKFKKKNQENTESAEQAAEAQKSSFENVAGEIAQYSEILVGITGALFSKQNEMLAQEIEAAKEKYEALSAKYDEAVEKRKESDQKLQNLEEQAKSARGGRLLHIQGQIDAEMAKNKQLSDQEKKLQTDKDKLQKDIEKKQKQQKKNEMKQQMISALANVATGATMALAQWGFPLGIINAAILGATGALQVAAIGKQMSKLEDGGLLFGRLHREGGMRIEGTNIEVEGGEYVVNRDSTRKNMGLIRYINSQRRELDGDDLHNFFNQPSRFPLFAMPTFSPLMEQGGQVPMMPTSSIDTDRLIETIQGINFQPRVSVTDIHTVQGQMTQVDEWVGM